MWSCWFLQLQKQQNDTKNKKREEEITLSQTASVPGSSVLYQVHPECKKYTLRDNGFIESKSGKFQLIRSLSFGSESNKEVQTKIVVSSDLKKLKLYTTTTSLQSVNVYKNDAFSKEKENLEAILSELCNSQVLERVGG